GGRFGERGGAQRPAAFGGSAVVLASGGVVTRYCAFGHIFASEPEYGTHVGHTQKVTHLESGSTVIGRGALHVIGAERDADKAVAGGQRGNTHLSGAQRERDG